MMKKAKNKDKQIILNPKDCIGRGVCGFKNEKECHTNCESYKKDCDKNTHQRPNSECNSLSCDDITCKLY